MSLHINLTESGNYVRIPGYVFTIVRNNYPDSPIHRGYEICHTNFTSTQFLLYFYWIRPIFLVVIIFPSFFPCQAIPSCVCVCVSLSLSLSFSFCCFPTLTPFTSFGLSKLSRQFVSLRQNWKKNCVTFLENTFLLFCLS